MFNRILKLPLDGQSSIFLFGPRGTGKTSWLKEHLPTALYLDLLDFETLNMLSSNPGRLEGLIPADFQDWIIIDEVQKVPELLNEVHRLIEGRKLRFLLTGSSARNLRKKGTNLLAGRALTYYMHPLVIQEIDGNFDLNRALTYGMLPNAVTHPDPKQYLKSYIQTYIREEVLQEGLTRNIGSFNSFLEAASFSQGSLLNFSKIGRELNLNRLLVSNYFDILDDLLLAKRLMPFTRRAKREMVAHQKFYFFDAGVYSILRPRGLIDTREEIEGAALETLFLQSIQAINDYYNYEYTIYFWRTQGGAEVDFILYGPRGFHAFEIKRSSKVTSDALKGLKLFGEDYPEAKLHLIYLGKHKQYQGPITSIPFMEALQALPEMLK